MIAVKGVTNQDESGAPAPEMCPHYALHTSLPTHPPAYVQRTPCPPNCTLLRGMPNCTPQASHPRTTVMTARPAAERRSGESIEEASSAG